MPKFKKGETAYFIGDSLQPEEPPKQLIQKVYRDKKGEHLVLVNDDWVPEGVLSGWEEIEIRKLETQIKSELAKERFADESRVTQLQQELKAWKKIRARRQRRR